jgi:hypothetical protein
MTPVLTRALLDALDARVDWAYAHGTADELRTWQAARKLFWDLLGAS